MSLYLCIAAPLFLEVQALTTENIGLFFYSRATARLRTVLKRP